MRRTSRGTSTVYYATNITVQREEWPRNMEKSHERPCDEQRDCRSSQPIWRISAFLARIDSNLNFSAQRSPSVYQVLIYHHLGTLPPSSVGLLIQARVLWNGSIVVLWHWDHMETKSAVDVGLVSSRMINVIGISIGITYQSYQCYHIKCLGLLDRFPPPLPLLPNIYQRKWVYVSLSSFLLPQLTEFGIVQRPHCVQSRTPPVLWSRRWLILSQYIVGSFACIGGGLFGLDISSMSGVLSVRLLHCSDSHRMPYSSRIIHTKPPLAT